MGIGMYRLLILQRTIVSWSEVWRLRIVRELWKIVGVVQREISLRENFGGSASGQGLQTAERSEEEKNQ
jgi:hypothetical protein